MKNKLFRFGFIHIVIGVGLIEAQTYPTIHSAEVQTQVTHDTAQQIYYYHYSVFSDPANTGNIIEFVIDISRNPNSVDFDTVGLIFEDDFVLLGFREEYPLFAGRIVPVGFPHSPGIWYGDFSNYLTANFSGTAQVILPGDSLGGFTMMSKGLPGIRYCIVEPDFDVVALFPDYSDTTITDEQVDSIREAVKYRGFTVGPTAPPVIFNGINFLDTIKSFINPVCRVGS